MFRRSSLILAAVALAASCASPSGSAEGPREEAGGLVLTKLSLGGQVWTLSGKPGGGAANVDGPAGTAVFHGPVQMTTDGTSLYVVDQDAHAVRRVSLDDGGVTTIAGGLGRAAGDVIGAAADARFNSPCGITFLNHCLYLCDQDNQKIKKIDLTTGRVSLVAGVKGATSSADGVGTGAHLMRPTGITNDGTFLYVCDSDDGTVKKVNPADGSVSTIVGHSAGLGAPRALTTDGKVLYVADTSNYLIRKVDLKTLAVTTLAGSALGTSATGPATGAGLGFCEGILADGTDLYFDDSTNNQVFRLDLATSTISVVAGSKGSKVEDGLGTAASFAYPAGLASDGTSLFVADYFGKAIRRID